MGGEPSQGPAIDTIVEARMQLDGGQLGGEDKVSPYPTVIKRSFAEPIASKG